jgi:hypothetical protein
MKNVGVYKDTMQHRMDVPPMIKGVGTFPIRAYARLG